MVAPQLQLLKGTSVSFRTLLICDVISYVYLRQSSDKRKEAMASSRSHLMEKQSHTSNQVYYQLHVFTVKHASLGNQFLGVRRFPRYKHVGCWSQTSCPVPRTKTRHDEPLRTEKVRVHHQIVSLLTPFSATINAVLIFEEDRVSFRRNVSDLLANWQVFPTLFG